MEPRWRERLRRERALMRARDEALAKVDQQRKRLAKLERKHATVKGDLRVMVEERNEARTEAERLKSELRLVSSPAESVGHVVADLRAERDQARAQLSDLHDRFYRLQLARDVDRRERDALRACVLELVQSVEGGGRVVTIEDRTLAEYRAALRMEERRCLD